MRYLVSALRQFQSVTCAAPLGPCLHKPPKHSALATHTVLGLTPALVMPVPDAWPRAEELVAEPPFVLQRDLHAVAGPGHRSGIPKIPPHLGRGESQN
jgi:hypothetical protein